jgi:hypothetical protein
MTPNHLVFLVKRETATRRVLIFFFFLYDNAKTIFLLSLSLVKFWVYMCIVQLSGVQVGVAQLGASARARVRYNWVRLQLGETQLSAATTG